MTTKIKKLRIAMAGGWTGGHVFPIRSLLYFFKNNKDYVDQVQKIYWFGSKKSLEQKICHEIQKEIKDKIDFVSIYSWKYRRETYRKSKLKNIPDMFLFVMGIFQSLFYLLRYRIDVIFCKWWYVALPVVLAGALLRKKIIVHESDTRPGLVNKIASRFAYKVFTGFDWALNDSETIGQLLSDDIIVDLVPKNTKKTLVLVVGGSQWSQRLYEKLVHIFENTSELEQSYEFLIALGFANEEMSTDFDKFHYVHTYGFLSQKEMGELYNKCDVVITRGGTTALAEQKLYDIQQIIVPIPWTHDQYDNAKRYVKNHGDISINQRDDDFEDQLIKAIKNFKWFKKVPQKKDKKVIISKAKIAIRKSLLSM